MGTVNEKNEVTNPPEYIAGEDAYILQRRKGNSPFVVALDGITKTGERGLVRDHEQVGATRWFEAIHLLRGTLEELLQRIHADPSG
jgi:hypothetical protein